MSELMPGRHHRVEVNGIRLHYTLAGSGEPLVLLHGFPMTSIYWRKIIPALAEQFTVVAPDLRGCGDSDRPSSGYDKRTVAEDVHCLVEHLGLGPINLVSHDVGMMVAYAYASLYPAEVRRLVLIEAALAGLGLENLFDAAKNPRMFHLPLFEVPNGLAEALITGREKLFVAHMMRQQAYDTTALEEHALDEYARHLAAPGALHGGIEYFRAHTVDASHNRDFAKTKLPMPVLGVGGTASLGAHPELVAWPPAERLHSHDRRVRTLPRRGTAGAVHGSTAWVPGGASLKAFDDDNVGPPGNGRNRWPLVEVRTIGCAAIRRRRACRGVEYGGASAASGWLFRRGAVNRRSACGARGGRTAQAVVAAIPNWLALAERACVDIHRMTGSTSLDAALRRSARQGSHNESRNHSLGRYRTPDDATDARQRTWRDVHRLAQVVKLEERSWRD